MGMGSGIVLFIIGAILVFALNVTVDWVDLNMVGYLLMGAGFLVFIISLIMFSVRRNRADGLEPLE